MASAVTSIYEYPISAASAAYAPTNTAEVTAMIDSAVSGKLDASASSAFQPSGNYQTAGDYVSSSELANYQTTAGMSAYATTAALADKLDASASSAFQPSGDYQTAGDYVSSSELADFQTTAGMSAYQTVEGMSAYQSAGDYATTADLSAKLDASAEVVTSIGTTELPGVTTFVTSINGNPVSSDISDRANKDMNGRDLTSLAASSSLADYQTTAGMSGYATTADLSAKLDASASSAFVTSTAGLVSTGDLENYQTTAGMSGYATTGDLSAYLETSAIETSTAGVTGIAGTAIAGGGGGTTYTAGQYIQISGDEISVTGIDPNSYATTADLSAKLDASASSAFLTSQVQASWSETSSSSPAYIVDRPAEGTLSAGDYMDISVSGNVVTLGVTGVATTADLSAKLDASASSAFITSTAGLVSTGDLSSYLATSSIGVDTASAITSIAGSSIAGGGGGASYTAGQYIQISGDEISVTGIDPNSYATTADLSAKLDVSASSAFLTAQEQASWSETASSSPSYIVDKPDLVDIVAGPGIVVDNPDGNTLRVSMAADYETVLWDNPNGQSTGQLSLSESPLNFEYVAVYAQAKNPIGSDGFQYGNFGQFYSRMLSKTLKNQGAFVDFVHMDGNNTTTAFTWYSLTTKWSGASTTTWTWCRSELNGNSVNDWYYMLRIVGIHRIAGGN